VLLPHLAAVEVEAVSRAGGSVRVVARAKAATAACPGCGAVSGRVHSGYERRLLDTAAGGCEVVVCLAVRRFFCLAPDCAKVTFAEQVSGLTSRHARRTPAVTAVLEAVALALGGRAGARLSGRLAAGVSRMTLIRLIRAIPDPGRDKAPRVLGVDEFALRKGHRYGTLLVDVETHRPIDILDERSSESFAAWLKSRPGTELICRDRAGVYADGGARGAPDAIQVADRWHLWHNLGEAVERAVTRHREHLPAAVAAQAEAAASVTALDRGGAPAPEAVPAAPRTGRIAGRTRARHTEVHRLRASGRSILEIAAELGLARNTVRRFLRAAGPGELLEKDGTGRRPSILEPYEPYLRERWNSGCTNATMLWQEIRARGYPGGYSHVRDHLARYRVTAPGPAPAPVPPKAKAVTAWIMTRPDRLADREQDGLAAILAASPDLATVTASVRAFAALMSDKRGRDLEKWMTAAHATGEPALRSFVTGLRADQDAVTAGLSLPWSSGAVEGHVNRIKMLKRQMYGRASTDLLRRRILLAD
jgi:transposase